MFVFHSFDLLFVGTLCQVPGTSILVLFTFYQGQSEIWQIWREDGCSFGDGNYLDVNYHSFDPFRLLRGSRKVAEVEEGEAEIWA